MASSMIHLAIIQCIIVKTEFVNLEQAASGCDQTMTGLSVETVILRK